MFPSNTLMSTAEEEVTETSSPPPKNLFTEEVLTGQCSLNAHVMTGTALRYTVWLAHELRSCARSPLGFALVYAEA
ncbi:hypothetical protein EYF80_017347 [Liparis tanakae]|uniref:Uncharacterized protein n=1 Tax=Liparis tanakae TaxID=230148 RepID=A0A4Z2I3T6_9TELE|nr:hypothetical protein EYF80_017347 [Liparis tanakae]